MKIPKIKNWPFSSKEKPVLCWINSPYMENVNRQWRTTVTFKNRNNIMKIIELPWGMLPWLKLGQYFQDGQPILETVGREIDIRIPLGLVNLAKARDVIPKSLYCLHNNDNLLEKCFVFKNGNRTIILPVIEAIRAIFAVNKSLTYGLLEPSYLQRITKKKEVNNQVLNLAFTEDIPQESLTETTVRLIARILYDDSFNKSWHGIYSHLFTQSKSINSNHGLIPLMMELPKLSESWRVRAVDSGQKCLILEILSISPNSSLPFHEIYFEHPAFQKVCATGNISQITSRQIVPLPASQSIDISEQSPNQSNILRIIDTINSPLIEPNPVNVTKVKTITQVNNTTTYEKRLIPTESEETVTLSDKAPKGKFSAAEFESFSGQLSAISNKFANIRGFDKFSKAIEELFKLNSQWQGDIAILLLEREIPFANVDNDKRKYAVVTISSTNSRLNCYILEFSRPDFCSISTLIFSMSKDINSKNVISQLTDDALMPSGSWKLDEIEKIRDTTNFQFRFMLAKHCNDKPEEWGIRLGNKVSELINEKQ